MAIFKIKPDVRSQYYWTLVAGNGETVAVSESYTTKYSAIRSAERVRDIAHEATIKDET
jgi:uncharacterized protein YegP (UPF0339 family)